MHTIHRLCRVCIGQNLPQVSIVRGSDGFGFTICSDSPVRVQAVEPGGPAQRSGLLQSDFVLQLNGVPVESWRCIDLAHAIRNCSTQIVLVVWRILPDMKQQFEGLVHQPSYQPPDPQQNPTHTTTTVRKLLPHPPNSKHGRRRGQGSEGSSGGRSGLGALGSLWRDRKEERGEEVSDFSPCTTLKGTRVTSSNGDDYIILSPVNPGSQPVYQDRMGTVGRLYQTHPSRGLHQQNQHLLHDPPPGSLRQPFSTHTATLPPPSSSSPSSAQPGNYGNYQNCTMVQSHLPCSGYGTYVTLAPKTLIFPMFVQPLELCSPDRTLLMSEEMILHKGDLLPIKVTVLIYSDLLLLSREDEAGRCNVLQSPLYLHTIRLHHVASEPLRLYVFECLGSGWECVFSLEAFSVHQSTKVRLCLHDNINRQLGVTSETTHSQQCPVEEIQSDLGLLSLDQTDLPYRPSSPYASLYHPPSPYSSSPPPPFSSPLTYSFSPEPYGLFPPPPSLLHSSEHPRRTPPPPCSSSSKRSIDTPLWKEREREGEEEEERRRRKERERAREQVEGRLLKEGLLKREEREQDRREETEEREQDRREETEEREQDRREEKEEREEGEGESASEMSEVSGARGFLPLPHPSLLLEPSPSPEEEQQDDSDEDDEEEEGGVEYSSSFRRRAPPSLQRSLSEGSLLQEPRSPCFLSDSTIHRLTRPMTFNPDHTPCPSSPQTLRRELTREGGSLQQMFHFLYGRKDSEFRNISQKRTTSLAAEVRSRLAFLRRRRNNLHDNSLEKALRNTRPSPGEVLRWAESFDALLTNKYGLAVFRHFLRSEFSEENLDFWLAVEKYKRTRPLNKMATRAIKIFNEFISTTSTRQVNVDSSVREVTNQSLCRSPGPASFQLAQDQIYSLMESDSYPRFLKSRLYSQMANHNTQHTQTTNQNEPGSTVLTHENEAGSAHPTNRRRPASMVGQS